VAGIRAEAQLARSPATGGPTERPVDEQAVLDQQLYPLANDGAAQAGPAYELWAGAGLTSPNQVQDGGECLQLLRLHSDIAGMESQSFNEQIKQFQERFIAGWAGYPVVGTPEQVVEELGRLNDAGMDGMIMGFIDYNEEMKYFGERVLPLMKQAGLRH
jgi:alkanesulfonate monooxygenase SsuD/methylene tetrahydromethanopterin reductase-like flavin-dependent oxidoreductase (luciferase family)